MKKSIVLSLALLATVLFANNVYSQHTLNVSGGSATLQGNTYEYAIGEMTLVHTAHHPSLIITQGFLQPHDGEVTSPSANPGSTLSSLSDQIRVYPNPTTNIVYLELQESQAGNYQLDVYDAAGRILHSSEGALQVGSNKLSVNLETYASGNYYLFLHKPNTLGVMDNYSYQIQKIN